MTDSATPAQNKTSEVSYGPACLVVFIFLLVALSLFFVYMSMVLLGNQGARASRAIKQQLIPWIEGSDLSPVDRKNVIEQLEDLAFSMEREELTSRQLSRLNARLSDSPVFQWGTVERLNQLAQASELSDEEKTEFSHICDRWFHCAALGKLSIQDMEFGLQQLCTRDGRSGRLMLKKEIGTDMLREYMRRVTEICERFEVPKEEFNKSISQVLKQIIEDGLKEK